MKYGTTNQSAGWDPLADVYPPGSGDGKVDVMDLSLIGLNYVKRL
jgi:hypothetical protein